MSDDYYFILLQLEKLNLHKIPVFHEPAEEEEEEAEADQDEQQREAEAQPAETESNVLVTYEVEKLEECSQADLNALLQKEEEYLKTLTPNLNTLKDYEKKVMLRT